MFGAMRRLNSAWTVFLVFLVMLATGCGGKADETVDKGEKADAGEVLSVNNKDMRVDFVKLVPEQQRQIGNELVDGFAVTLKLKDLKGRSISAGNYSFLAPLYAVDDKGKTYESISIAAADKDSGNNTLPAGQILITLLFTPKLDQEAKRINVDFKIKPLFFYPDTVVKNVKPGAYKKIDDPGIVLDDVLIHRELKQISFMLIQNQDVSQEKKLTVSSYLVGPSGEIISAHGLGTFPEPEEGSVRYQLDFPLEFSEQEPFDMVLKWMPGDEAWEFKLKNILITGFDESEQARRELGELNIDYSRESFFKCILENDMYVAGLFIKAGMDPNVTVNSVKETPLMGAAYYGYTDIAHLLLENGAYINLRNENGETALMYAASEGHPDVVKLLLQYNADAVIEDNNGETAIDFARGHNHGEIVKMLE